MKDAEKNEIDLLLRNLAKTQRPESRTKSAHLDADELNSFAEGQLPPATRSLYVTHLADCDRCRRIVAQLAPASVTQDARIELQKKQTIGSVLARLFSPTMMRYAIPALAVVILGIAGVLWIKREPTQFVAEQTKPTRIAETPSATPETTRTNQSDDLSEGNTKRAETKRTQETERESTGSEEASRSKKKAAAKTGDTTTGTAAVASPAPAKEAEADLPPASPAPAKTEQEAAKDRPAEPGATIEKQSREVTSSNAAARDASEERSRADKGGAVARKAPQRSSIFGSVAGLASGRDEKSATRSVGGRQFRQTENIWIDTAYTAGTKTTNIKRGSEQYRALIGDEPGLRTIAEQLDGEIIVVWKGTAYRIR